MAEHSNIEWTDATWNPITGCSVVSPGCTNCYAMRLAGTRLQHHRSRVGLTQASKAGPVWTGDVRWNEEWADQPVRWKRPRRIFVCAHGDLFHEAVPDAWIDSVWRVMALTPRHTFQVLTKRPERMKTWAAGAFNRMSQVTMYRAPWPLPNVWLGVSVEDQRRTDERIPHLLGTPAAVRFLSVEPMLGPIVLPVFGQYEILGVDWVICGGESGPGARDMEPGWASLLRAQCRIEGVPFFMKQMARKAPIPDDLLVREFPR